MTGPTEVVSPPTGCSDDGLGRVSARFLRPGMDLTHLTLRRSEPVHGGLTRQVRNLTRQRRPNLPGTRSGRIL